VSRRLNKSVLVGGVVYPAGAEGDDVEKAVTNPEHWDDFEASPVDGLVDEAKVLELITFAKTTAERLEALLVAVAPLVVSDPVETDAETLLDLVFNTDEGLGLLTENVQRVVALHKQQAAEGVPSSSSTASETPAASTPEPVDYSGKSKPELEDEVKRRNEGRDKPIEVKAPGNKPDLIAALVADDKKN
jgi:hypothetical protein